MSYIMTECKIKLIFTSKLEIFGSKKEAIGDFEFGYE